MVRTFAVAILLALGALLAFSANATVWANRTVFNTDEFVDTVNNVLDNEETQQRLSVRLSNELIERGEVQARIAEALPEGLEFLAAPLTIAARDLIQSTVLRVIQSEAVGEVFDRALRELHSRLVALLEDRDRAIQFEGDQIIIDLREILERAAEQLGVGTPEGLLARLELPEDAGQIVLVDDAGTARSIYRLTRLHDTITWVVIGSALAAFGLAVLISRDRRGTARTVGYAIFIVGILAATVLVPIREIAASFAQDPTAAKEVFADFVLGYRVQSFIVMLMGLLIAGIAALFGPTVLARAIRSAARRQGAPPDADLRTELQESATALRVGVLAIGALVLLAWPEPSTRVYVTAFALIGAFVAGLWIITSESEWAGSARDRIGSGWQRLNAGPTDEAAAGWFAAHLGALRVAGLVVTIAAVMLWPEMTLGVFAALVGGSLLYFAFLEWLASRPAAR